MVDLVRRGFAAFSENSEPRDETKNTSFARDGFGSGQDGEARRRTPSTLGTLETERAIWLRRLTQLLVGEATTTE